VEAGGPLDAASDNVAAGEATNDVASEAATTEGAAGDGEPGASEGAATDDDAGGELGADVRDEDAVLQPLLPPVFSPPSGTALVAGDTIQLQLAPGTPAAAQILFTTDGSVPVPLASNTQVYGSAISLTQATTALVIMAVAHPTAGNYSDSPAAMATYVVDPNPCAMATGILTPPFFMPSGGTMYNDFQITLSTPYPATLCYTLDGSEATATRGVCTGSSMKYDPAAPIAIDGTLTVYGSLRLSALAVVPDCFTLPVSWSYTLAAAPPAMSNPVPGPVSPTDGGGVEPTIASTTVSSNGMVSIHYTTDGATPTCTTGTVVSNESTIPLTTTTTIQAITCKPGYQTSDVATFTYTF
jgi:hypothetical protein